MRTALCCLLLLALVSTLGFTSGPFVQFVVTSDSHYGITRAKFRGQSNVNATVVNHALVTSMNRLSETSFPADAGLRTGEAIGSFDFLVDLGDIANREEDAATRIQSASTSWGQFRADYLKDLNLPGRNGGKAPVYMVPGNHDVSNAIGFYNPMFPRADRTSMVEIYNLMMAPQTPKKAATFKYPADRIFASRDVSGIHFVFITIWPDTQTRQWMERDLKQVPATTPVIIFTHDPPDSDPKHFTNPNGRHDINSRDKFENILTDELADTADGAHTTDVQPIIERTAFEDFLHQHPNVTAYFHGHSNWNQYYDWTGPQHSVTLHTFRLDSPMKGKFSAADETQLSYQIATIDTAARTMTVREILWNGHPNKPNDPLVFGSSTTVSLTPRQ